MKAISRVLIAMTIVLYLGVRKKLDRREGAFDLGRLELPVAVSALVWAALVIFMVIAPAPSLAPVGVIAGLVLTGGVYWAYMWFAKREVLEHEPGEDVFNVDREVVT
jgi:amino acid transporter